MINKLAYWAGKGVATLRSHRRCREATADSGDGIHDVVVIGAGISGVMFLERAAESGLRCIALEKQEDVGGLWNQVPSWQDIQNRRADFGVGDIVPTGVKQRDIQRYVRARVDRHDLGPRIRLETEVTGVSWQGDHWLIETDKGTYEAQYLVVASGGQNDPFTPEVERSGAEVVESHSSQLSDPSQLADRVVTVVGGGASAWDLLDLTLENGAKTVNWVYRNPRWFLPTRTTKHDVWPNIRELAVVQSLTRSVDTQSAFLRGLIESGYRRFGLEDIQPSQGFDVRRHMLIPGRSTMLDGFDEISRHHAVIRRIEGNAVQLSNGEQFETDHILWGTGYRMDLDYLGLAAYEDVDSVEALLPRLGSLVRSKDYPRLFFLGMTLLETTSATPFIAAVESKSIVSHIQGRCEIPLESAPHQINYWNLIEFFASFDHSTYPRFWWRVKYLGLALRLVMSRESSLPI